MTDICFFDKPLCPHVLSIHVRGYIVCGIACSLRFSDGDPCKGYTTFVNYEVD